jgi:ATP-dependent Clp protease adaptor protein ClpS
MSNSEFKSSEGLEEKVRQETRQPSLYRVILLNDDYTPMDFVIYVLESVFHKPAAEAMQIMLNVHKNGSGVCGVFTREIAETKISAVHGIARKNGHPLKCVMERE